MNMHGSIQLYAAAEKVAGFTAQIKSVFEYSYFPLPMELACNQIELNVKNKDILTARPIKKIKVVEVVKGDDELVGNYDTKTRTIMFRETVVMRMYGLQVALHEFAHHFDSQWLTGLAKRETAVEEFTTEKSRVEKLMGHKFSNEIDDDYEDALKVGTVGISLYSLKSDSEWIAEAFALYFSGYPAQLFRIAPATYKLIDNLCQGKDKGE